MWLIHSQKYNVEQLILFMCMCDIQHEHLINEPVYQFQYYLLEEHSVATVLPGMCPSGAMHSCLGNTNHIVSISEPFQLKSVS